MRWSLLVLIVLLAVSAVLYSLFLHSELIDWFGVIVQLIALILAVLNLNLVRDLYRPGDEPRSAWSWFTIGALLWTIAQVLDIHREMILRQFPTETIADIFWLAGYLPFAFGMFILIRSFFVTGLSSGSKSSYLIIVIVFVAIYFVIFQFLLLPEFNLPGKSAISKILLISYPAFDILMLGMSTALLRISWALRGGKLSNSWIFLCAGFALGAIGDLIFVHLTDVESNTYRYLDLLYFPSYFCIVFAARIQIQMLRSTETG